jgi:hypothetical protein
VEGASGGDLNTFHLIRDRGIPWDHDRDNGEPGMEISTPVISTETEEFRAVWKGPHIEISTPSN